MSKRDLTKGSIYKHIIAMALPMMIGLLAHMLLNLSDAIYVSRLGFNETQAVLNYSFPMFYVPFAIFNGLNIGISAILSQKIGEQKIQEAQNILSQCMIISVVIFIIYFLFFGTILEGYFDLFSPIQEVQSLSTSYLNIIIYGVFLVSISLVLGGALKSEGNMMVLMKAMMLGTLVNLIVDPFLIFDNFNFLWVKWSGLGWGVEGAAWATFISDAVIFIIIFSFFLRKKGNFCWPTIPTFKNITGLIQVFKVSFPAMISQAIIAINLIVLTYLLKDYGADSVTALGISVRLDIIAIFPALSIAAAVTSLVGQNYGAKDFSRIYESVKKCLILGFLILFSLGIIVNCLKVPLISLFNPINSVELKVNYYLSVITLSYGFIALSMISGGFFQGLGRGFPAMFFVLVRSLGLTFFLAWFFSRVLSLSEYGIYLAPTISNTIMGIITTCFVFYTLKHLKNKIKSPAEK